MLIPRALYKARLYNYGLYSRFIRVLLKCDAKKMRSFSYKTNDEVP